MNGPKPTLLMVLLVIVGFLTACDGNVEATTAAGSVAGEEHGLNVLPIAPATDTIVSHTPTPAQTVTEVPTPAASTPIPTQSPTNTPLPLSAHTWAALPVLIQFSPRVCVDSCYGDTFSALPRLILYSDGLMIIERYVNQEFRLQGQQMPRNEMCALLNTIDLFGFLEYDPTEYYRENLAFPRLQPSNYIEVNAWQSNQLDAGGLDDFFTGGYLAGAIELDPALVNTYRLLLEYSQQDLDSYFVPERIIVLIKKINQEQIDELFDEGVWPLADVSLEDLFNNGMPLPEAPNATQQILEGPEALTLFELYGQISAPSLRIYSEEGQPYVISVRALLPYESLLSIGSAYGGMDTIPGPDVAFETNEITCLPEDGVVGAYYSILEDGN